MAHVDVGDLTVARLQVGELLVDGRRVPAAPADASR